MRQERIWDDHGAHGVTQMQGAQDWVTIAQESHSIPLMAPHSLLSPIPAPETERQLITWHHRSRSSSSNQKYANTKVCFFSDFNHVRWKSITESSHVSLPSSLDREHSMSLIPARSPLSMQPHSSASHLELWLPPLQAATPPFCSICFSEPHLLPPL